jgi:hypothetical protein
MNRRLSPRHFDNTRRLVSTRYGPVHGTYLTPGQDVPDDLSHAVRLRMWMSRRAVYADDYSPTPTAPVVPVPDEGWMVAVDGWQAVALQNGWYALVPDDFDVAAAQEGEHGFDDVTKAHGAEAAQEQLAELRDLHAHNGVALVGGSGGWFSITAPWLAEPVKMKGADKAQAERQRIAAEGPPEGWQPPETEPPVVPPVTPPPGEAERAAMDPDQDGKAGGAAQPAGGGDAAEG